VIGNDEKKGKYNATIFGFCFGFGGFGGDPLRVFRGSGVRRYGG
jgi:hypothetical protein